MLSKWTPLDVVTLAIILSCVLLIMTGHNGVVLAVFAAASGGYLGYDIGRKRGTGSGDT